MNRVLPTLLAFGLAWLLGHYFVAILWSHRSRTFAERLIRLSAAFGFGMGIAGALDFLWIAGFGKASRGIVIMDVTVLAVLAFARRSMGKPSPSASAPPRARAWAGWSIFVLFTVISLGIVGSLLLRIPDGVWDALAIWNLRAKFLNAPSPGGWKAIFDPIMLACHPDYPPLLPALVARGWTYVGQSIPLVPATVAFGFTFALLALITGAVASVRSASLGGLACAMLAASPIFLGTASSQYADLPLAFYFLLSAALLFLADQETAPRPGLHVLAGLAAGMAALTKNEGLLFIVALGAGRLVHLLVARKARRELESFAWLLLGMAPLLCILFFYKSFAPPNYLVSGQGKDFWGKLLSRPRAQLILAQLGSELGKPHDMFVGYVQRVRTWHWHLFASWSFIMLVGVDRRRLRRPWSKWGLLLALACLLADIGITHFSTGTVAWHWPVTLAASALIVGLGFDLRRLCHPALLASITTLVVVNAGYFVVYMLTPLDLHWQLANSIERLLLHIIPLTMFVAFAALAPGCGLIIDAGAEDRAHIGG